MVTKKVMKKRARSATAGDAGARQKRLQMLREKNSDNPSSAQGINDNPLATLVGEQGGGEAGHDKRELIKKIVKKKRQQSGAGDASGQRAGSKKKGLLRQALKKKSGKGNGPSRNDLEQFPRLKDRLKKKRNKTSDNDSLTVEELQARVAKLEKALKKTLQQLEKAKALEMQVPEKALSKSDEAEND